MDPRCAPRRAPSALTRARSALAAALALLAALAAPRPARAADRYLAVLEFTGSGDRFVLEALAERVRSVSSDALRGSYLVITRDNVVSLLRQNQVSCDALADASCSVDLGRAVGADLVLSGRVRPVEDRLELGLQLHETASGALVASDGASVATPLEALERVESLARSVLHRYVTPSGADVRLGRYFTFAYNGMGTFVTWLPHEGDVGCGGGSSHECGLGNGMGLSLAVGVRRSPRWAWEVTYAYLPSTDQKVDDGTGKMTTGGGGYLQYSHSVTAGVEWTPFDVRMLALAASAGPVFYDRMLANAAPPFASSDSGWGVGGALVTELRLGVQLKFLWLGLQGGPRFMYAGKSVSSPDGTRRAKAGIQLDLPVYFALRFG